MITLIAAASENNVIGRNNDLPWELPDDLKHFRDLTRGHPVIMGRKNYESIASRLGGPLPKRRNIVISRQEGYEAEGCEVVGSLDEAIALVQGDKLQVASGKSEADVDEIYIIGGGQIYEAALPLADRIELTRVHAEVDGDVFFPEIDLDEWQEVSREDHLADDNHAYAFTFLAYERR